MAANGYGPGEGVIFPLGQDVYALCLVLELQDVCPLAMKLLFIMRRVLMVSCTSAVPSACPDRLFVEPTRG